jgi:hypothetical protein
VWAGEGEEHEGREVTEAGQSMGETLCGRSEKGMHGSCLIIKQCNKVFRL